MRAFLLLALCSALACSGDSRPDLALDRGPRPRFDRGPRDGLTPDHGDRDGSAPGDGRTALDQPRELPDLGDNCDADEVGKTCSDDGDCALGHYCQPSPDGARFCSCPCRPDDPFTPFDNEDRCPLQPRTRCGTLTLPGGSIAYACLRTCVPKLGSNDCQAPFACHPDSGEAVDLFGQAACAFTGCKGGLDCPVFTSWPCLPGALACPAGLSCAPLPSGEASWACALPGVCDLASGLCAAHPFGLATAQVGDPCASDLECGGSMQCLRRTDRAAELKPAGAACQSSAECCSNACVGQHCSDRPCPTLFRNGYCTVLPGCSFDQSLPERNCPAGSTCNRYYGGGICQRLCDLTVAEGCRGNPDDRLGDYECRDWSTLLLQSGEPVAFSAVCDFGPLIPCNELESSGLSCTVFGVDQPGAPNATDMRCRTLQGTPISDPLDPTGFCLDNTASGVSAP